MAIVKYRLSSRGRPRELDTDLIYKSIRENMKDANKRLLAIEKMSKGVRGEKYFGSATSLPDWIDEAIDILNSSEYGRDISPSEAEQIRLAERSVRQLASKQERVYSKAISDIITEGAYSELREISKSNSKFTQKYINAIKSQLNKLTKSQRQTLLTSKAWQEPKTAKGRYKNVKNWAQKETGKTLTYDEAWAYTLYRRTIEGLPNDKLPEHI